MGGIFEELIRRFNEASNEEAGDHFTPREVIRLMVDVLFLPDEDILTQGSIVKTIYDPGCGTGGMLSVGEDYIYELNSNAKVILFGQDYNPQAYAICGSDMLIKGQDIDNIAFGDSFTNDKFPNRTFDYCLVNPPFGVEWKPQADFIKREHEVEGEDGRFGAGLPRINDGSLLFLQHLISKMQPVEEGGTRMAIVFNGSPLFTGAAGSGESEIRRWILENDWLEGIIALPDQLFYNTGIFTYIWILSNRKTPERRGKVQLVDGTSFYNKMRKSLGNKRNFISDAHRHELTRLYGDFSEGEHVKIFDTTDFGYHRITVERPLRLNFAITDERLAHVQDTSQFSNLATSKKRKDKAAAEREIAAGKAQQATILEALASLKGTTSQDRDAFTKTLKKAFKQHDLKVPAVLFNAIVSALSEADETAPVCVDKKGNVEPDSSLRDNENVPLKEDIEAYVAREVLPHVPDAWVDDSKTKVGYEINFNRYFYQYEPPRPLAEIESDLTQIEAEIAQMLAEMAR
jgi:type I restriction enzyme M protein